MQQPGNSYGSSANYRYGFNGKENDNDVKGNGDQLDFGSRIYDPRVGRWLSRDIVTKAFSSPYAFSANDPVNYLDPDGQDEIHFINLIVRRYVDGKVISAKSTKFVIIYKNNQPDVFVHNKIISSLDGAFGYKVLNKQITNTRFYPEDPHSKSGLTSSYYGTLKDDDRTTLIKFIDDYSLQKQDVESHTEFSAPGSAPSDRLKKAQWWGKLFDEKKTREENDKEERVNTYFVVATLSTLAPELVLNKIRTGLWLGGELVTGFDVLTVNPKIIWGKSAQEVQEILGPGWTKAPLNDGEGWKFINEDKFVSFSEGSSRHGNSPYYKINSGASGKLKVVGPDYKPTPGEKSTIITVDQQ